VLEANRKVEEVVGVQGIRNKVEVPTPNQLESKGQQIDLHA